MIKYLVSYFAWVLTILILLFFSTLSYFVWVLLIPFKWRFYAMHYLSSCWAWSILAVNPYWSVKILNREKLVRSKPCVFISNHQSMVDIIVLFQIFVPFRWIAKQELFKIPFMGWSMSLAGYIQVDRASRTSFAKLQVDASKSLKANVPVMIFPEGTRTMTGELNNFKEGAFRIALLEKTSIQPIILDGSFDALPKKGLIMTGRQRITVKVLDEIPYNKLPSYDSGELANYFNALYLKEVAELKLNKRKD